MTWSPAPFEIWAPLTCSLVHRQLIGQDPANLAEGRHLDAILLQLDLHVVDLLLCEGTEQKEAHQWTEVKTAASASASGSSSESQAARRQTVPGSCRIITFLTVAPGAKCQVICPRKSSQTANGFHISRSSSARGASENKTTCSSSSLLLYANFRDTVTFVTSKMTLKRLNGDKRCRD